MNSVIRSEQIESIVSETSVAHQWQDFGFWIKKDFKLYPPPVPANK